EAPKTEDGVQKTVHMLCCERLEYRRTVPPFRLQTRRFWPTGTRDNRSARATATRRTALIFRMELVVETPKAAWLSACCLK
ncbi:MAG: hypothetical protein V4723_20130, partial [Pseudomonadota bacterium]